MGAYEKFAQVYDLFMDNIDYEEQFMTTQVYECILHRVILKL